MSLRKLWKMARCASVRKWTAAVLGAVLLAPPAAVAGEEEQETAREQVVIGVSIPSTTDSAGLQYKRMLDAAAAALDVKLQYADQGDSPALIMDSVHQLVDYAGCQGIVVAGQSDYDLSEVLSVCEAKGALMVQCFKAPAEGEDAYEAASKSASYLGAVVTDDRGSGRHLAESLLADGCRKIGVIASSGNEAGLDGRLQGVEEAVAAWNEAHADDPASFAGSTVSFSAESAASAADFLEADGLISTAGNVLSGLISAGRSGTADAPKLAAAGFPSDLSIRLYDGSLAAAAGGQYGQPMYAFMMVYHALAAQQRSGKGRMEVLEVPELLMTASGDYDFYRMYFVERLPYSAEEFRKMAEGNLEELRETAQALTLEEVHRRSR